MWMKKWQDKAARRQSKNMKQNNLLSYCVAIKINKLAKHKLGITYSYNILYMRLNIKIHCVLS